MSKSGGEMINLNKLKKKIIKPLFFYWIKKDFNRNLDLLEVYKLRKYIKKNISKESIQEAQIPDLVDYISSFVISTYSNPTEIPAGHKTIDEEAKFIVKELIEAYKISVNNKECDLVEYLGIPKLDLTEEQRELFLSKSKEVIDEKEIYELQKKGDFKEKLDYIFGIVDKYYKENYKRFWRPGVKHYAIAIWYIIYLCVNDVDNFSKEYKIEYIDDGEQRCLFNYFNLYIHNVLFTGEILLDVDTRKTIFAASAIHPAQDDYIDKNNVTEESIELINRAIKGEIIEVGDEALKPTINLINFIYSRYPAKENPKLVDILLQLNKWQANSITQKKKKDIDEEELLEISFMKGGYAFAFYGYIALGKMNSMDFRHFFGMGAIFQIMDDLHDIEIDLKDSVETIWTKRINKNMKADEVIYGIIGVQKRFEEITNEIETLKRPVFLRRMELFAVRLDLTKFYFINRKYFSDDILENFELVYDVKIEEYLNEYELQMDQIKTMDEFKKVLIDIKNSYVKAFIKRKK